MRSRAHLVQEQSRLLELLPEVRWRLRHIPSITNIGIGAKEVGGDISDDFAFRVYVDVKLPPDSVARDSKIPPRISGIATDVLPVARTEPLIDIRKLRPLKGGVQLKNQHVDDDTRTLAGTIGCLVRDSSTSAMLALTCEHVLLAAQATIGSGVGQPKYVETCCCCTFNVIGTIFKARKNAQVDCATVKLDSDIVEEIEAAHTIDDVEGIGTLNGVAQAVCFETVRKRGRTSELTTGRVIEVLFEGSQIVVRPTIDNFADFGDSGSVIVNAFNRVVGLLWGTNTGSVRNLGVANHIGPVMQEMDIVIAGMGHTGLGIPTARCPQPPP